MKRLLHALDPRNATQAWLALLVITVVTAGIAVAERGVLPWVGWIIAALVYLRDLQSCRPLGIIWVDSWGVNGYR